MMTNDNKPMSKSEYRALLARLKLTQSAAADELGIGLRTSVAYANGRAIPLSTAKLLRLWARMQSHQPKG